MGVGMIIHPGLPFREFGAAWDGGWYLSIVQDGYAKSMPVVDGRVGQSNLAFFPLYPLLTRGVRWITGLSAFRAALLLAVLAGAVACVLLWRLARDIAGVAVADRGVALFAFFPSAYVLSMTYSESVMLALATGTLLSLHHRRWLLAGLLAAAATAARPNAIALCFSCAVAAFLEVRRRWSWRPLLAPLLSPLGLLMFAAYLWGHVGDPTAAYEAQRLGWGQEIDFGATTATRFWDALTAPLADINLLVAGLSLIFMVTGAYLLFRWRPPAILSVYAAGVLLPVLISESMTSRHRFAMTAFPLLLAVAWRVRGAAFSTVLATSAGVLGLLTVLVVSTGALTP